MTHLLYYLVCARAALFPILKRIREIVFQAECLICVDANL